MASKKKATKSKPTAVGTAEELQVKFINQIRHAMVDLSIGQMELAERAGMSQSYVSELFNLKKSLTVRNALKLVKALNPEATLEIRIANHGTRNKPHDHHPHNNRPHTNKQV